MTFIATVTIICIAVGLVVASWSLSTDEHAALPSAAHPRICPHCGEVVWISEQDVHASPPAADF